MDSNQRTGPGKYILAGILIFILLSTFFFVSLSYQTNASHPGVRTAVPSTPASPAGVDTQLSGVDSLLGDSLRSFIAYNAPQKMKTGETTTIELLLNPSLSSEELNKQVTESGVVASGTVDVTPLMKAELISYDGNAFEIRPIHAQAEQVVSGTDTTRWAWLVTAKKGGSQRLTLTVSRIVDYNGQEYWREVATYQANIDVDVTFAQLLGSIDWKWLPGTLVSSVIIPFFWRLYDNRKKTGKSKKSS